MIRPRALLLLFIWRFFFPFAFLTERIQQANYTFATVMKILAWAESFFFAILWTIFNIHQYSTQLKIMSMDQFHGHLSRSSTIPSKRNSSVTMTQNSTFLGEYLGTLCPAPLPLHLQLRDFYLHGFGAGWKGAFFLLLVSATRTTLSTRKGSLSFQIPSKI